jgi:hypothetical protein
MKWKVVLFTLLVVSLGVVIGFLVSNSHYSSMRKREVKRAKEIAFDSFSSGCKLGIAKGGCDPGDTKCIYFCEKFLNSKKNILDILIYKSRIPKRVNRDKRK